MYSDELVDLIKEKSLTRKIAVFGAGKASKPVADLLDKNGLDFEIFDNSEEKQGLQLYGREIVNPEKLKLGGFYTLVATAYFTEIIWQLKEMGLKEIDDWLCIFDTDYCNALIKTLKESHVPGLDLDNLHVIEKQLHDLVDTQNINYINKDEIGCFEAELGFQEFYHKDRNKRYNRKILEYYLVNKILKYDTFTEDDIYLDIGACNSPYAKWLREQRKVSAYAVDLCKGCYDDLDYYLQEDATKMHFSDSSIRAISMQSAYEMFEGTADIDFISEAARVLKPGGEVVILPLYMHMNYLSTTSPNNYGKGYADKGSFECIRTDCYSWIRMARFYDAKTLKDRIIDKAEVFGLKATVYVIPEEYVEIDDFVYLKFVLHMKKIG